MKINLKLSKIEIIILLVVLLTSPLVKIVANIPTIGGVLLMEGIAVIFLSIFGFLWMFYSYGKRGERAWSGTTVEKVKTSLPRIILIFAIVAGIGFLLALLKI